MIIHSFTSSHVGGHDWVICLLNLQIIRCLLATVSREVLICIYILNEDGDWFCISQIDKCLRLSQAPVITLVCSRGNPGVLPW